MDALQAYQAAALELAVVCPLEGGEGFEATIPRFNGLIVFGDSEAETREELESGLKGWVAVSLRRGCGLPELSKHLMQTATAH